MENARIAAIFAEMADLLELREDNPFRIRSYRNAAQEIRNLSEPLETRVAQGEDLTDIPHIGESTAAKIHEILKNGTCKQHDALRKAIPTGVLEIMHVPGIGPRKAMQLHRALKIGSLDDLKLACEDHRVRDIEGMGIKTENKILRGIRTVQRTRGRLLYREAAEQLQSLARHLDSIAKIDRWEVAGSFRRAQETIGDLDILVHTADRERATDAILKYDTIQEQLGRGEERVSVRLESGLQVDFRFVDSAAFGAAWMYFTGSKAHNIKVRRAAQAKKWKLNEYGLFSGTQRLAGETEKAVYKRLSLQWVPPELREDSGEVEAAAQDRLPRLITADDIRGDFQCHTTASDGSNSIAEMAAAARDYGFSYLAITDHSQRVTMANGLDDDRARNHADAIREAGAGMKGFRLLAGIEVDILKNGDLDLRDKTLAAMDWVVASVHYDRVMSRKAMTDRILAAVRSGLVHSLGHPLGRIIGKRDPILVDMDRIIDACVEYKVRLEINCQPDRLDLPDTFCRRARDAGATFTLATDAHSVAGFQYMPLGINVARRGWLRKQDVLNTKTMAELDNALAR